MVAEAVPITPEVRVPVAAAVLPVVVPVILTPTALSPVVSVLVAVPVVPVAFVPVMPTALLSVVLVAFVSAPSVRALVVSGLVRRTALVCMLVALVAWLAVCIRPVV
ncbi:MAG: hypothetical protein COW19_07530 [Zetaproteobacteria bacterium CG12_big_fil_rev_8_21_14_0_65_55_1124]|nr:MAG: hypothetical protein COW19_07530 [Zetaproteobacteria bacterium CG12_big_fil_rev_8_21_14_0_65_55_1124]PIY51328.1 MAG: hypothetical protein COZ01_11675 [Zetaproteobacteria bacterium CG_4_10_14_0_8_um_filter_55_43]PJB80251.1 MAG: hypothetical protein CO089_08030 [Zetaproteobacteria bacterium CG_4_9_14_0_8_um_filter_55_31]